MQTSTAQTASTEASTTASLPTRRAAPLPAAERRAVIIDAALPLLIEQGTAVTTRQIANAAGIAEGTVFSVFTDKDELLTAALEHALDPAAFEGAIEEIDPATDFDQRLIIATELIQRRVVDVWRVISNLGPGCRPAAPRRLPDSPALAALLASEPGRLRKNPAEAARLLRSLTLSLSHPLLTEAPHSPNEIVEVFLHGIGARDSRHDLIDHRTAP